jgi:hypothetical protein
MSLGGNVAHGNRPALAARFIRISLIVGRRDERREDAGYIGDINQ